MNSIVTTRSATGLSTTAACAVWVPYQRLPVSQTLHSTLYNGTSAKPNAKLPAVNSSSLPTSGR